MKVLIDHPPVVKEEIVHWLENVDGNKEWVRIACGQLEWHTPNQELLDPNRAEKYKVTCPGCLKKKHETKVL